MDSSLPVLPARSPSDAVIAAPVIEGPRWYRTRIRLLGPFAALIVPGLIGAVAVASNRLFEGPWSGAIWVIGGVLAAPGLLAAGAPFGDDDLYPMAIGASVLLWLFVGVLASRRATRNPVADWADYWRHYAWMCAGIWVGCVVAMVVAWRTVGQSLF